MLHIILYETIVLSLQIFERSQASTASALPDIPESFCVKFQPSALLQILSSQSAQIEYAARAVFCTRRIISHAPEQCSRAGAVQSRAEPFR